MKGPIELLKGLFRSGRAGTAERRMIHLPDDIIKPEGFVLFSGPKESDVWPALYMTNTLQKAFPHTDLKILCRKRDDGLFSMLGWRPEVHCYEGMPKIPESLDRNTISEAAVFVYPYSKVIEDDERLLRDTGCGILLAPLDHPSPLINFVVKTRSQFFPEKLAQMCSIIGLEYDDKWKPRIQRHMERAAEHKMAPVTGRKLPYIVTTSSAEEILRKSRAEIPLRTVSLGGKKRDFTDLEREIKISIIASASAVATDSDDLWGDACAFGVPAVGLDLTGTFIKWHGIEASHDEKRFVEAWVELLKKEW